MRRAEDATSAPTTGAARARVAASGLAALLLLLLVAALARGAGDAGTGTGGGLPSPTALLPILVGLFAVVFGSVIVGMVLTTPVRRGWGPFPVRPLLLTIGLFLLAAALLSLLAPREPVDPGPEETPEPPPAAPPAEPGVVDDWLPTGPVALVVVLAMAAGGLVVARFLRRDDDGDGAFPEEGAVEARRRFVTGLDDVIGDLRDDPDPRRAVIRAWARLESLLAAHDLPRRPAEAPVAYVGRVLGSLDASAPALEQLTATFERAMFSLHPIGRDEQVAAVEALVRVRDELEARV